MSTNQIWVADIPNFDDILVDYIETGTKRIAREMGA
jgi:hypothetical protein